MIILTMKIASLNNILATRAKVKFAYRINFDSIAHSNLDAMTVWCEENCKGLWHSHNTYAIYWQFEDEKDAIMFMLRWGGSKGNSLR